MPYINQPDDEELKKQQEAQSGAPTNISGQSAILSTEAPSKMGGAKDSGSFTNLNQYLEANKENAGQMGTKIASDITGQGQATRTGIQDTSTEFNQLADQGTLAGLDKAPEEARNIVQQARTGAKNAQIDQNQMSRFGEIANAQYKGPQDLTGTTKYANTAQQYKKAQQAAKNASSDEGRFSLLKDAYARPTYSQGQQNLDNLLLTGNQGAKANIQAAATGLNDLSGLWSGAQSNAAQLAAQRQAATNAAREGSRANALEARTGRNTEVQSDLASQQAKWADEYNQYKELLGAYGGGDLNLTREQADRLALGGSGTGLYNMLNGIQPESYLDLKAFDANKVVSQDQFAQLRALDQLTSQFGSPAMSQFIDENQAGTLDAKRAFDASGFGRAADNAQVGFQNYAQNATATGHGAKSEGIYEKDLFGSRQVGTASSSVNASQLLNDYLQGRGNIALQDVEFDPSRSGGEYDRSRDAATASAKQDLFNNIQNMLNQQGYQNRVRVK